MIWEYRVLALDRGGKYLHDDKSVDGAATWSRARSQALDPDVERIRIIDGEDYINAEWVRGLGIIYPPELAGRDFRPFEVRST